MIIAIVLAVVLFILIILVAVHFYVVSLVDKRISRYQSDLMEKHCEEVENMYRQTRGWRHDLKNHMQTMKAHMAMGEMEALEKYINELDADLTTVDRVIKTGNVMIDAVLNSKLSLARSKNIQVEAKAIVPTELPISEVDLSVILGNLMDNAMEACMKIEEEENRFLRVYIDVLKGQLYIYVMNSMKDNPKRFGKLYLTTKDRRDHGFGLMRIDKVVEKYRGYLDRQNEEGVFATEVMLPL